MGRTAPIVAADRPITGRSDPNLLKALSEFYTAFRNPYLNFHHRAVRSRPPQVESTRLGNAHQGEWYRHLRDYQTPLENRDIRWKAGGSI